MLTYQLQRRRFKIIAGGPMKFPNKMVINIKFSPPEAFGTSDQHSRLALIGRDTNFLLNGNTGRIRILSKPPLKPIHAIIEWLDQRFELIGDEFQYESPCDDEKVLEGHLITFVHVFPAMLNIYFADPPTILHTQGHIGETVFRWEQVDTQFIMNPISPEDIEKNINEAFLNLEIIRGVKNRRFAAALYYFYTVSRLVVAGNSDWEFMAEIILNLCKALQILFGSSRDEVREGLLNLGYEKDQIEGDFIPIMILRDDFDVGHPMVNIFSRQQLDILYLYLGNVENIFRDLFKRLLLKLKDDSFSLDQKENLKLDSKQQKEFDKLIETMKKRLNRSEVKKLITEIK
jgi:hypothetical protein